MKENEWKGKRGNLKVKSWELIEQYESIKRAVRK